MDISTLLGLELYKNGKATLCSVQIFPQIITLLISLNSFQSSSFSIKSQCNGSNLGPPGIATFNALAVKNASLSNK